MKVILDNFNYKGKHFERYEADLPQVKSLEEVPEDKLIDYICESLDEFIKQKEEIH